MTRRDIEPCYQCNRFAVSGHTPPPAHGYCEGFERYVRYDDRACVLFNLARNGKQRDRWAEQQRETA